MRQDLHRTWLLIKALMSLVIGCSVPMIARAYDIPHPLAVGIIVYIITLALLVR